MPLPDLDSFDTVGGELAEYTAPTDSTTDLPGGADNNARANVAAMTRMMPRAYAVFLYNGSTVTIVEFDAVWGNDPLYKPTPARTSAGVFTLTYPATVPNARPALGTSSLNIRRGHGQVENGPGLQVCVERTSANVATARVFLGIGATDPTNKNVVVFLY